jgi:hypothetical protein
MRYDSPHPFEFVMTTLESRKTVQGDVMDERQRSSPAFENREGWGSLGLF